MPGPRTSPRFSASSGGSSSPPSATSRVSSEGLKTRAARKSSAEPQFSPRSETAAPSSIRRTSRRVNGLSLGSPVSSSSAPSASPRVISSLGDEVNHLPSPSRSPVFSATPNFLSRCNSSSASKALADHVNDTGASGLARVSSPPDGRDGKAGVARMMSPSKASSSSPRLSSFPVHHSSDLESPLVTSSSSSSSTRSQRPSLVGGETSPCPDKEVSPTVILSTTAQNTGHSSCRGSPSSGHIGSSVRSASPSSQLSVTPSSRVLRGKKETSSAVSVSSPKRSSCLSSGEDLAGKRNGECSQAKEGEHSGTPAVAPLSSPSSFLSSTSSESHSHTHPSNLLSHSSVSSSSSSSLDSVSLPGSSLSLSPLQQRHHHAGLSRPPRLQPIESPKNEDALSIHSSPVSSCHLVDTLHHIPHEEETKQTSRPPRARLIRSFLCSSSSSDAGSLASSPFSQTSLSSPSARPDSSVNKKKLSRTFIPRQCHYNPVKKEWRARYLFRGEKRVKTFALRAHRSDVALALAEMFLTALEETDQLPSDECIDSWHRELLQLYTTNPNTSSLSPAIRTSETSRAGQVTTSTSRKVVEKKGEEEEAKGRETTTVEDKISHHRDDEGDRDSGDGNNRMKETPRDGNDQRRIEGGDLIDHKSSITLPSSSSVSPSSSSEADNGKERQHASSSSSSAAAGNPSRDPAEESRPRSVPSDETVVVIDETDDGNLISPSGVRGEEDDKKGLLLDPKMKTLQGETPSSSRVRDSSQSCRTASSPDLSTTQNVSIQPGDISSKMTMSSSSSLTPQTPSSSSSSLCRGTPLPTSSNAVSSLSPTSDATGCLNGTAPSTTATPSKCVIGDDGAGSFSFLQPPSSPLLFRTLLAAAKARRWAAAADKSRLSSSTSSSSLLLSKDHLVTRSSPPSSISASPSNLHSPALHRQGLGTPAARAAGTSVSSRPLRGRLPLSLPAGHRPGHLPHRQPPEEGQVTSSSSSSLSSGRRSKRLLCLSASSSSSSSALEEKLSSHKSSAQEKDSSSHLPSQEARGGGEDEEISPCSSSYSHAQGITENGALDTSSRSRQALPPGRSARRSHVGGSVCTRSSKNGLSGERLFLSSSSSSSSSTSSPMMVSSSRDGDMSRRSSSRLLSKIQSQRLSTSHSSSGHSSTTPSSLSSRDKRIDGLRETSETSDSRGGALGVSNSAGSAVGAGTEQGEGRTAEGSETPSASSSSSSIGQRKSVYTLSRSGDCGGGPTPSVNVPVERSHGSSDSRSSSSSSTRGRRSKEGGHHSGFNTCSSSSQAPSAALPLYRQEVSSTDSSSVMVVLDEEEDLLSSSVSPRLRGAKSPSVAVPKEEESLPSTISTKGSIILPGNGEAISSSSSSHSLLPLSRRGGTAVVLPTSSSSSSRSSKKRRYHRKRLKRRGRHTPTSSSSSYTKKRGGLYSTPVSPPPSSAYSTAVTSFPSPSSYVKEEDFVNSPPGGKSRTSLSLYGGPGGTEPIAALSSSSSSSSLSSQKRPYRSLDRQHSSFYRGGGGATSAYTRFASRGVSGVPHSPLHATAAAAGNRGRGASTPYHLNPSSSSVGGGSSTGGIVIVPPQQHTRGFPSQGMNLSNPMSVSHTNEGLLMTVSGFPPSNSVGSEGGSVVLPAWLAEIEKCGSYRWYAHPDGRRTGPACCQQHLGGAGGGGWPIVWLKQLEMAFNSRHSFQSHIDHLDRKLSEDIASSPSSVSHHPRSLSSPVSSSSPPSTLIRTGPITIRYTPPLLQDPTTSCSSHSSSHSHSSSSSSCGTSTCTSGFKGTSQIPPGVSSTSLSLSTPLGPSPPSSVMSSISSSTLPELHPSRATAHKPEFSVEEKDRQKDENTLHRCQGDASDEISENIQGGMRKLHSSGHNGIVKGRQEGRDSKQQQVLNSTRDRSTDIPDRKEEGNTVKHKALSLQRETTGLSSSSKDSADISGNVENTGGQKEEGTVEHRDSLDSGDKREKEETTSCVREESSLMIGTDPQSIEKFSLGKEISSFLGEKEKEATDNGGHAVSMVIPNTHQREKEGGVLQEECRMVSGEGKEVEETLRRKIFHEERRDVSSSSSSASPPSVLSVSLERTLIESPRKELLQEKTDGQDGGIEGERHQEETLYRKGVEAAIRGVQNTDGVRCMKTSGEVALKDGVEICEESLRSPKNSVADRQAEEEEEKTPRNKNEREIKTGEEPMSSCVSLSPGKMDLPHRLGKTKESRGDNTLVEKQSSTPVVEQDEENENDSSLMKVDKNKDTEEERRFFDEIEVKVFEIGSDAVTVVDPGGMKPIEEKDTNYSFSSKKTSKCHSSSLSKDVSSLSPLDVQPAGETRSAFSAMCSAQTDGLCPLLNPKEDDNTLQGGGESSKTDDGLVEVQGEGSRESSEVSHKVTPSSQSSSVWGSLLGMGSSSTSSLSSRQEKESEVLQQGEEHAVEGMKEGERTEVSPSHQMVVIEDRCEGEISSTERKGEEKNEGKEQEAFIGREETQEVRSMDVVTGDKKDVVEEESHHHKKKSSLTTDNSKQSQQVERVDTKEGGQFVDGKCETSNLEKKESDDRRDGVIGPLSKEGIEHEGASRMSLSSEMVETGSSSIGEKEGKGTPFTVSSSHPKSEENSSSSSSNCSQITRSHSSSSSPSSSCQPTETCSLLHSKKHFTTNDNPHSPPTASAASLENSFFSSSSTPPSREPHACITPPGQQVVFSTSTPPESPRKVGEVGGERACYPLSRRLHELVAQVQDFQHSGVRGGGGMVSLIQTGRRVSSSSDGVSSPMGSEVCDHREVPAGERSLSGVTANTCGVRTEGDRQMDDSIERRGDELSRAKSSALSFDTTTTPAAAAALSSLSKSSFTLSQSSSSSYHALNAPHISTTMNESKICHVVPLKGSSASVINREDLPFPSGVLMGSPSHSSTTSVVMSPHASQSNLTRYGSVSSPVGSSTPQPSYYTRHIPSPLSPTALTAPTAQGSERLHEEKGAHPYPLPQHLPFTSGASTPSLLSRCYNRRFMKETGRVSPRDLCVRLYRWLEIDPSSSSSSSCCSSSTAQFLLRVDAVPFVNKWRSMLQTALSAASRLRKLDLEVFHLVELSEAFHLAIYVCRQIRERKRKRQQLERQETTGVRGTIGTVLDSKNSFMQDIQMTEKREKPSRETMKEMREAIKLHTNQNAKQEKEEENELLTPSGEEKNENDRTSTDGKGSFSPLHPNVSQASSQKDKKSEKECSMQQLDEANCTEGENSSPDVHRNQQGQQESSGREDLRKIEGKETDEKEEMRHLGEEKTPSKRLYTVGISSSATADYRGDVSSQKKKEDENGEMLQERKTLADSVETQEEKEGMRISSGVNMNSLSCNETKLAISSQTQEKNKKKEEDFVSSSLPLKSIVPHYTPPETVSSPLSNLPSPLSSSSSPPPSSHHFSADVLSSLNVSCASSSPAFPASTINPSLSSQSANNLTAEGSSAATDALLPQVDSSSSSSPSVKEASVGERGTTSRYQSTPSQTSSSTPFLSASLSSKTSSSSLPLHPVSENFSSSLPSSHRESGVCSSSSSCSSSVIHDRSTISHVKSEEKSIVRIAVRCALDQSNRSEVGSALGRRGLLTSRVAVAIQAAIIAKGQKLQEQDIETIIDEIGRAIEVLEPNRKMRESMIKEKEGGGEEGEEGEEDGEEKKKTAMEQREDKEGERDEELKMNMGAIMEEGFDTKKKTPLDLRGEEECSSLSFSPSLSAVSLQHTEVKKTGEKHIHQPRPSSSSSSTTFDKAIVSSVPSSSSEREVPSSADQSNEKASLYERVHNTSATHSNTSFMNSVSGDSPPAITFPSSSLLPDTTRATAAPMTATMPEDGQDRETGSSEGRTSRQVSSPETEGRCTLFMDNSSSIPRHQERDTREEELEDSEERKMKNNLTLELEGKDENEDDDESDGEDHRLLKALSRQTESLLNEREQLIERTNRDLSMLLQAMEYTLPSTVDSPLLSILEGDVDILPPLHFPSLDALVLSHPPLAIDPCLPYQPYLPQSSPAFLVPSSPKTSPLSRSLHHSSIDSPRTTATTTTASGSPASRLRGNVTGSLAEGKGIRGVGDGRLKLGSMSFSSSPSSDPSLVRKSETIDEEGEKKSSEKTVATSPRATVPRGRGRPPLISRVKARRLSSRIISKRSGALAARISGEEGEGHMHENKVDPRTLTGAAAPVTGEEEEEDAMHSNSKKKRKLLLGQNTEDAMEQAPSTEDTSGGQQISSAVPSPRMSSASSTRSSQRLHLASRGGAHSTPAGGGDTSFPLSEGGRVSADGEDSSIDPQHSFSSSSDQPRRLRSSDRITRGVRTSSSSAAMSLLPGASPRNSRLVLLQESSSFLSEINAASKNTNPGLSSPTSPKKIFSHSPKTSKGVGNMKGDQPRQQVSSPPRLSSAQHEDEEGRITSSLRASSPPSRSTLLSSPSHQPVHAPASSSSSHHHSPRMRTRSSTSHSGGGGGGSIKRDLSQPSPRLSSSSSKMSPNSTVAGAAQIGFSDKDERRPRQSADQTAALPPLSLGTMKGRRRDHYPPQDIHNTSKNRLRSSSSSVCEGGEGTGGGGVVLLPISSRRLASSGSPGTHSSSATSPLLMKARGERREGEEREDLSPSLSSSFSFTLDMIEGKNDEGGDHTCKKRDGHLSADRGVAGSRFSSPRYRPSKVRDAVTGRVAVCAYDAVKKERVKKVQLFEKEGEGATWCVRFGKNDECIRCFPIEKYGSAKALWYAIRFRQRVTGHPLGDGIGSRLLSPHESPERKEQEKDSQREQLLSPSSLSRSNSSPRRRLLQSSPVSNGKDGGVSSYSAHKAKEGKEEEKRDIVDTEQRGEEEKEEEGQEVRGKDVDGEKDEVTGKEMEVDEKTQTTDKRGGEEEQEEKRGWVSGLREGSSFVETKEEERREGGVVNERDGEKEGDRTQETLHDVEEMKGLQEKDLHSLEKTTLEIAYTQHAGEGESRGRMGEAKEREDILPSRQVIIPENGKEEGSSLDKKTESVDDIETSHRVGREETSSMRMGEGESITSPGVGHAFIEERKKAQDIEKEKGSPTNSLTKDSSPSIERKEMVDRACNLEEERKTEGVSVSSSVQVPVVQVTREEERGSLSGGNADQDVERRDEETPMMKVVIEEKEREEAYYRRLGEDEIKTTENGEQRHDEAKQGKMVIEEERKAKDTEIALVGGDERTEEKTSFRGEDDHKCQKKDKHDSIDGHVDHTVDESIDKEVKEGISAPLQSSLLIESSQEEDPGAKSSSSPLEGGTGETSLGYLSTGEKIKEEKKKEAICPNEDQHQDDLSLLSSSKSLLQEENKSDTEGEKKKERADGFSSLVGAPGEGDQTSRGGIGSPEEKHKSVNRIEDSAPPTGLRHSMEESVSSSSSCSPGRLSPGTGSSPDQQGEDEEGVGQASKVVLPAPKTPSPSRLPLVIRADGWIDGEEEDLQHDDEEERQEEEEASRTLEREDEEEERFSGEGDDHDGDRRRFPSSSRHSLRSPRAISSSRFIEDGEDDDHNSILVTPREKKALTPLSSLSGLMRDPHHAIEDADEEDGASILPGGGIFTASSSPPSSKTHRVSKISLPSSPSPSSSFQRRDPTTGVATAGVSTTVKGGGGGGMASPTGPGVHYDRTKQRWKATWTTCEGQRASISFSVKTLGMEKARKLAFEARQQALAGKDPRDLKLGMGSGGGETGRRQKNVKSSSSVSSSRAAVVSPSRSIKKERREDTERGRKTGDKKKRLERERTKTAGQEAQGGPRVRTPRMASQKGSSGTTGAGGATPTSSLMVNTRENSSDRRTRLRKMESPLANSNDSECLEEDHEHDRGARREEEGSDLLGEGREEEERMKKNDKTTERAEDSIRRKRRVSVLSEEEGEREEAGEERVEELSHSRSSGRSREKRRRSSRRDLIHGEDHDGETVLSMKKARKKGNEEVSHRNRGHDGGRDEDIFSSSSSLSHARHHKPQVSPRDGEEEEGEEEEEDFLSMSSAVEPCVVDDGLPRHDDLPSPSPSSPPSASSLTHKHLSTPHNREDLLLPSLVHSIPASIATPDTERTSKRLTSSSSSLERSESLHLPERTSLSPSSFIDPHTSPQASSSSLTGMTFPTMTSRNPPLSLGVSSSLAVHTTAATPTTLSPSSPTRSRSLLVTSSTEKDEMKAAVSLLTPEVASSITPDSNAPPSSLSEEQASSSSSSTGDARSRRRISGRREEARASPLIIDSEETIEEGDVGRKGYLSSSSSSCPEKKRRTNEDHIDSSSSSSMSNREEGKKDVEGEGRSLSFSSGRFLRLRGVVSSPLGREERDKEEDEGDLANDNNNDDDAKEDGKATIQLDSSGMNDLKAPTIEKEEKAGGGRDMSPSSSSSSSASRTPMTGSTTRKIEHLALSRAKGGGRSHSSSSSGTATTTTPATTTTMTVRCSARLANMSTLNYRGTTPGSVSTPRHTTTTTTTTTTTGRQGKGGSSRGMEGSSSHGKQKEEGGVSSCNEEEEPSLAGEKTTGEAGVERLHASKKSKIGREEEELQLRRGGEGEEGRGNPSKLLFSSAHRQEENERYGRHHVVDTNSEISEDHEDHFTSAGTTTTLNKNTTRSSSLTSSLSHLPPPPSHRMSASAYSVVATPRHINSNDSMGTCVKDLHKQRPTSSTRKRSAPLSDVGIEGGVIKKGDGKVRTENQISLLLSSSSLSARGHERRRIAPDEDQDERRDREQDQEEESELRREGEGDIAVSSSLLPSPRLPLRRRSKRLVDDLRKNHLTNNSSSSSLSSTEILAGVQPVDSLADGTTHNNDVPLSAISKERSSHTAGLLKVKKEIQGKITPSSSTNSHSHSNSTAISTTKRGAGGSGSEVSLHAVRASLSSPLVSHSSPASATPLSPKSSSPLSLEEEHDGDPPLRKKEMTIHQDAHRPSRSLRVKRKEEEEEEEGGGRRRRKSEEKEKEAEEASLLSQQEEGEEEEQEDVDEDKNRIHSLSSQSHKEGGHVHSVSQNISGGSTGGGSSLRRKTRTSSSSSLDSTGRHVDDKWGDLQRSHSSSFVSSHIPPHATTHRQTPHGGSENREGRTTAPGARGTGDSLPKRSVVHATKLGPERTGGGGESGAGGGGTPSSSSASSVFVENALAITQLTELLGWDWEVEEEGTDEKIWTLLAAIPVPRPRPRYV